MVAAAAHYEKAFLILGPEFLHLEVKYNTSRSKGFSVCGIETANIVLLLASLSVSLLNFAVLCGTLFFPVSSFLSRLPILCAVEEEEEGEEEEDWDSFDKIRKSKIPLSLTWQVGKYMEIPTFVRYCHC